jgi:CDP-glucose 4,6-dehydratase
LARRMIPSGQFWQGKRVFLTGHTGFKGAWLAIWLHRLGAQVMGFSLPPDSEQNLSSQINLGALITSVYGDILEETALSSALRDFAPDVVLHLAAQSLVTRSYREPVLTFQTNVMGTVHLMEAVRRTPSVRSVVIVTTDKCYENREWPWAYREDDTLGGYDPYSSSKACAELAVAAWRRSYFPASEGRQLCMASARAGNVIGWGDWAEDRLIPDCIRALTTGATIAIRNPSATRPWQHVLEPLCGYLLLAEGLCKGETDLAEAWNFGPAVQDVKPVRHIVEHVTALWGEGASWSAVGGTGLHEAGLLAVDAAKARARLKWQPRLGLDDALAWSVRWYKAHRDGRAAADLVSEDIEAYEKIGDSGDE